MDTDGVEPLKTMTETRNMDSVQKQVREIAAGTPQCNFHCSKLQKSPCSHLQQSTQTVMSQAPFQHRT